MLFSLIAVVVIAFDIVVIIPSSSMDRLNCKHDDSPSILSDSASLQLNGYQIEYSMYILKFTSLVVFPKSHVLV